MNSGAGLVIFFVFNNSLKVILAKETRGYFAEFGGKSDMGETEKNTAFRETYEESCGLFNITKFITTTKKQYIDNLKFYYRTYFVLIDTNKIGFDSLKEMFNMNKKYVEMNKLHFSKFWNETTRIESFDVAECMYSYEHMKTFNGKYFIHNGSLISVRPFDAISKLLKNKKLLMIVMKNRMDITMTRNKIGYEIII
jgi:hypothetical protein